VPVSDDQDGGDEADQNYVPISLRPFPNGANLNQQSFDKFPKKTHNSSRSEKSL
jgi:hypothetical protein